MLTSASSPSASTAASTMRSTLRSASARRRVRGGSAVGVGRNGHPGLVDGDPRGEPHAGQEAAGGGQEHEGHEARPRRDPGGHEERVADAARCGRASPPAALVATASSTAMPSEPPISCPVVFRPDSMPLSSSAAPLRTETATETRTTPSPTPATSIPGRTSVT